MSDTNRPMTAGQMRQIIALATTTVPADLTYVEAARILRTGKLLRDKLGSVWNATRVPEETYSVKVPGGDLRELIRAEQFVCGDVIGEEFDLTHFEYTGPRPRRVHLMVKTLETDFHGEALRNLRMSGYRPADLREGLALIKQHGNTYKDAPLVLSTDPGIRGNGPGRAIALGTVASGAAGLFIARYADWSNNVLVVKL
jgi:hypothetical protein